ncbi:Uncharacterised protein [Listeria fleischmannii subsp. fleischmannii]|uniref:Uncharacterized protein n=1 Tax=Listeria fleischmannii subsp. fleischmannii TaxID=1671902 RepID=A0A2X3GPX4_9LIST|nr:Uncharacterised protein [Listeria fleischmannii subsp. fleischmannii]
MNRVGKSNESKPDGGLIPQAFLIVETRFLSDFF